MNTAETLSLLRGLNRQLGEARDLRDAVLRVLDAIGERIGVSRAAITLLNRHTGDILIDVARGLTDGQRERGRYRLGEGVTGRVVESGCAALIPSVADEPHFLDRTGARAALPSADIAFICVPIRFGAEVIGALSVDRPKGERSTLESEIELWSLIASLIASVARLRQIEEEERVLADENRRLRRQLGERVRASGLVGNAKAMDEVHALVEQVAPADTTVLIQGESGTGKELIASAIHYASARSEAPLVRVNCAALPESLLESELFGHEKGAFTGAHQRRCGRFEQAHGGTLFLDEVGELSAGAQARLLRVLQERTFERVGGSHTLSVDVRLIAATNRNLEADMQKGSFRADLFYTPQRLPYPRPRTSRSPHGHRPPRRPLHREVQPPPQALCRASLHAGHRAPLPLPLARKRA